MLLRAYLPSSLVLRVPSAGAPKSPGWASQPKTAKSFVSYRGRVAGNRPAGGYRPLRLCRSAPRRARLPGALRSQREARLNPARGDFRRRGPLRFQPLIGSRAPGQHDGQSPRGVKRPVSTVGERGVRHTPPSVRRHCPLVRDDGDSTLLRGLDVEIWYGLVPQPQLMVVRY